MILSLLNIIKFCPWTIISLFIYLFLETDGFQILAIVNSAASNIGVQMSFLQFVFGHLEDIFQEVLFLSQIVSSVSVV